MLEIVGTNIILKRENPCTHTNIKGRMVVWLLWLRKREYSPVYGGFFFVCEMGDMATIKLRNINCTYGRGYSFAICNVMVI